MTHSTNSTWVAHDGYIMRSRAESRTAAILQSLGISYVYEHMPYSHHGYLPDFYLPHLNIFIEVKGKEPTDDEIAKCEALSRDTGCVVALVHGRANLFMHHDHLDGYVRLEAGWMPRIFIDGAWSELSINKLCRIVYHEKGKRAGEKFVSSFATDGADRLQAVGPSALQFHDEIARKIGKTSRMIYDHNQPRTEEKLAQLGSASANELLCIDYLASRQRRKAA